LRGIVIFVVILIVSAIFCGVLPFVLMPDWGIGMGLPVITVPGEKLTENFLGMGITLTNTLVATLLADLVLLAFALGATRQMKEVPGRLQGLFEVLTDLLYGLAKSTAGHNAGKIFPLMATIFLFVLTANWLELVPGVDSIGLMHCAEAGISGYEKNGVTLQVDRALYKGERAYEENYELCHHPHDDPSLDIAREAVIAAAASNLGVDTISWKDDVGNGSSLASYVAEQGGDVEAVYAAALAAVTGELGDTGAAEGEVAEGEVAEGEAAEGETAEHTAGTPEELVNEALNEPFYRDDIYVVTSFVRAATTDLNLTLGLGLFAFIAIQVFGVRALGVKYFTKFINTPALERAGKNPMGIMDFAIGFLELISEVSRIISFGFRLFGNIFAGQVLLFVIPFLAGALLPLGVYGFEMFVGVIQAFVFAMLLLVFAAMAMAGHDHDEAHE
jgi:F-type H+-transporting ATPase subunit a